MTTFIAFIRGINVGGANKLPMADLRAMCEAAGLVNVETYIASGNVIFEAKLVAPKVKSAIEAELNKYFGKPVAAVVRTARELKQAHEVNPFADTAARHTYAFFLDAPPPRDTLAQLKGRTDEQVELGTREIYVHYPRGMGDTKLKIPAAAMGTARNMLTIGRLVEISAARSGT